MRVFLLIWMGFFLLLSCQSQSGPKQLSDLAWKPVDTLFSHYEEKEGDGAFRSGGLLGIELVAVADKNSGRFIPVGQLDSQYVHFINRIGWKFMEGRMDGKLRKNAEGYIRADLAREFPEEPVVAQVYIRENVSQEEIDTMVARTGRMREVGRVHFVSKEEAKKLFIANGNADFSAVLDKNPLPASVEVTIKPAYCTVDSMKSLRQKLETISPKIVTDYKVSKIFPELQQIRTQYLFFRYKT